MFKPLLGSLFAAAYVAYQSRVVAQQESCLREKMSLLTIVTNIGTIKAELRTADAPKTCAAITKLANSGAYNGCIFYRAEPGFVIQGGLRKADGSTKDAPKIPYEYNMPNKKGTMTMARWDDPNSATSEFFINLADNTNLDKYGDSGWALGFTVFANVIEGMNLAEKISTMPTKEQGGMKMLVNPVVFESVSVS
eukprot:m.340810 g.340810  ORF g.340810 m.340810 type:complete len:194 (+) comp19566_c0_seq1:129-710(+)